MEIVIAAAQHLFLHCKKLFSYRDKTNVNCCFN